MITQSRSAWSYAAWGGSVLLLAMALLCAPASAQLVITNFDGSVLEEDGSTATRAGAHPFTASTTIDLEAVPDQAGILVPKEHLKNVRVDLPAGFVTNPITSPRCPNFIFELGQLGAGRTNCNIDTQVGTATFVANPLGRVTVPLYNLVPAHGVAAELAFNASGTVVRIQGKIRTGGDYGATAVVTDSIQTLPLTLTTVTLWGVPADPAHDLDRGECIDEGQPDIVCPTSLPPTAFLTNPTSCTGPLLTTLWAESWQDPGALTKAEFVSHDEATPPNPIGMDGCGKVPFSPTFTARPTTTSADSPTGFVAELHVPQDGLLAPAGTATAHLKDAVVRLPRGLTVNPSSADGLGACSKAQIDLEGSGPARCPDNSKIGSLELDTPLLDHVVEGEIYLARQGENRFGSLLAIYFTASDAETGVVLKLPGRVATGPEGQLIASFDDNPQLPFEDLNVEFFGGPRAALTTPATCGTYTTTAEFSPWSGTPPVSASSSFRITSGPNGQPCPSGQFDPTFSAGTVSPVAGSHSPFVLRLSRPEGSEDLAGLTVALPKGLVGKLKDIPYCPDSALAAIPSAEGTGVGQLTSPSCPAASQLGRASVGAGSGPDPFFVNTGKAYLAGPYKGAPLSIAFVTPAIAGPFDLGNVLVRTALRVDPETAEITAVSDPLPTILHGIPLDLRDVRIAVDRPGFMLNPTSCDPMRVTSIVTSTAGSTANPESRFQVANCERLAFKPKLALKFSGKTHRSAYPALRATVTMPPGNANIARGQVTLPKTEILAQEHIKTICTRVQYAAKSCPKASIYGYAKAWSPLLDKPLQGPVYLRSSSNELPDLVASLDGQIHIDLSGRIDSVNARIRNTFEIVPDAPVSKFVLTMQGGKKGLLVNNTELCRAKPRAEVKFDAQNGKTADSRPLVKVDCGKKGKKRKK